jgi:hypothetical protein
LAKGGEELRMIHEEEGVFRGQITEVRYQRPEYRCE